MKSGGPLYCFCTWCHYLHTQAEPKKSILRREPIPPVQVHTAKYTTTEKKTTPPPPAQEGIDSLDIRSGTGTIDSDTEGDGAPRRAVGLLVRVSMFFSVLIDGESMF